MRKLYVIGLALVAMFAFTAVAASSASAVEYLWLVAGLSIEGTEEKASETSGELELADLGSSAGGAVVLCSGILDGFLLPKGRDLITAVLMLGGELLAVSATDTRDDLECAFTKAGLCEGTTALVVAVDLPWFTELMLVNGRLVDLIFTGKATEEPGWEVTCKTFIGEVKDTCTALSEETEPTVTNVTGGVEATFAEENKADCSVGGEKEGDVLAAGGKGGLVTSPSGTVTISEE